MTLRSRKAQGGGVPLGVMLVGILVLGAGIGLGAYQIAGASSGDLIRWATIYGGVIDSMMMTDSDISVANDCIKDYVFSLSEDNSYLMVEAGDESERARYQYIERSDVSVESSSVDCRNNNIMLIHKEKERGIGFDGTPLYAWNEVTASPDYDFGISTTLAFWMRVDDFGQENAGPVRFGEWYSCTSENCATYDVYCDGWRVYCESDEECRFVARPDRGICADEKIFPAESENGISIEEGEWVHLAFVYDAGNGVFIIYRDGEKVWSGSADLGDMRGIESWIALGVADLDDDLNGPYFNGRVDDLAIWKRALTIDEIEEAAKEEFAEDSLVGLWTFEEGAGDYSTDLSGESEYKNPNFNIANHMYLSGSWELWEAEVQLWLEGMRR